MNKQHVTLSAADKTHLEKLLKAGQLPVRTYKRATALLELNRGRTFKAVAETLGMTHQTVSIWAKRYQAKGLAGLDDNPRSGRPPVIDGAQRAKITALACSEPPVGYESWSLRLLADKAVELGYVETISHTEVGLILQKTT
ncbi:MAG: helix-turn-helix domain containing protein [Okeania sp. SIO3B3]|nr:helix-turn-helix domain containing protein [Okeania sp. SIO3B3]